MWEPDGCDGSCVLQAENCDGNDADPIVTLATQEISDQPGHLFLGWLRDLNLAWSGRTRRWNCLARRLESAGCRVARAVESIPTTSGPCSNSCRARNKQPGRSLISRVASAKICLRLGRSTCCLHSSGGTLTARVCKSHSNVMASVRRCRRTDGSRV